MRTRRWVVGWMAASVAVCVIAAGARLTGLAQSGRGTGLLMGVVVEALTDRPAAGAEVRLGGASAGQNANALTDADGRFVFFDLPKGTYTITATKAGYAEGAYGRRRPEGLVQTLTLADAERVGDLRVPLWKLAAITGTVRDEAGEPVVDVPVRALRPIVSAGRRKLMPHAIGRTDDRGIYRIASLTPGDYLVVVPFTQASAPESVVDLFQMGRSGGTLSEEWRDFYRDMSFSGGLDALNLFVRSGGSPVGGHVVQASSLGGMRAGVAPSPSSDGRMFVYPTQFHPAAATAAEAAIVRVASGDERVGVDVQLALVPALRVSGIVTGPDGPVVTAMTLTPESDDLSDYATLETATTLSDSAGRFVFPAVPPGRYQLRAVRANVPPSGVGGRGAVRPVETPKPSPTPPPQALPGYTLSAVQSLAVGRDDIEGLAVIVRPGVRAAGRAVFENATTPPDPAFVQRMSLTFDPADGRPLVSTVIGRGSFGATGQFWTYQLPHGRYVVRLNNAPPGWMLKSVMWNGQDMSNVPARLDRDLADVVVTLTNRPSVVSGQVRSPTGDVDATASVLIFPADPAAWTDHGAFPRRLRQVRVGSDGRYEEEGLPAGDYLIVAVADEASASWQDPRTMQALARLATTLTIGAGETRAVQLRTVTVPR